MNQILLISDASIEKIFKDCKIENGNPEAMKRALYSVSNNTQENIINYYEYGTIPTNIERKDGLHYITKVALRALRKKYIDLTGYEFIIDKEQPNYEIGVRNFASELYNYMKEYKYSDFSFATNFPFEDFYRLFAPVINEMINSLSADFMEIFVHRYGCIDGKMKSSPKVLKLLSFDATTSKIIDVDKKFYHNLPRKMWNYYCEKQKVIATFAGTPETEMNLIKDEYSDLKVHSNTFASPQTEAKTIEEERRIKF